MIFQNIFFYIIGVVFLILAKIKNLLKGYSSPKEFEISETDRCIEYDIKTVDKWLLHLKNYTKGNFSISGKNVLELGPGSDLGVGVYLISKGCSRYNAFDVNNLMENVPNVFYDKLINKLRSINPKIDNNYLKQQIDAIELGDSSKLNYVVQKEFDFIPLFGESKIDIIFSQAAFEHFDDMEIAVSEISKVCKPKAKLIIEIDLQTHSRWIRDKDPNNIYRFSKNLYNVFWFSGIPNRLRPFQYKKLFEKYGWIDIQISPLNVIKDKNKSYSYLHKDFVGEENQMEYLSIILCANKK